MAEGRETRAGIDSETVRGLFLINGGGAVALLAFLTGIIEKPELEVLTKAVIWSVFSFQIGLVCAVIHNRLRRICSLEFAKKPASRKRCSLLGSKSSQPCACVWSTYFMWASVLAFLTGGALVLTAGLQVLS